MAKSKKNTQENTVNNSGEKRKIYVLTEKRKAVNSKFALAQKICEAIKKSEFRFLVGGGFKRYNLLKSLIMQNISLAGFTVGYQIITGHYPTSLVEMELKNNFQNKIKSFKPRFRNIYEKTISDYPNYMERSNLSKGAPLEKCIVMVEVTFLVPYKQMESNGGTYGCDAVKFTAEMPFTDYCSSFEKAESFFNFTEDFEPYFQDLEQNGKVVLDSFYMVVMNFIAPNMALADNGMVTVCTELINQGVIEFVETVKTVVIAPEVKDITKRFSRK